MAKDHDVLTTLMKTLDPAETMRRHGLDEDGLRSVLGRAASIAAELEAEPAENPVVVINTDGAARGNPGPAGAGFVVSKNGKVIESQAQYLGERTNNYAEYSALILALERALELKASRLIVKSDSELMVRQIKGEYKVKNKDLQVLFAKASRLIARLESFEIVHVRREENREADLMANRAIDEFQDD